MVPHPTRDEGSALLGFVAEAESLNGPDPFTTELLDELATTMQCEFATFYTFDPIEHVQHDYVPCSLEARYTPPLAEGWRIVPEYADIRGLGVGLWSDALARPARRRYESAAFARAFEVVDCAWTVVESQPNEGGMLSLHRQEHDFTERDRARVGALRPHVASLVRNAHTRRRLVDLMAMVDSFDTSERAGFLLLGSSYEIEHVSPSARLVLERWFDGFGSRLPAPVDDWLRSGSRRQPFVVETDGRRLVIEAPTRGGLILTEDSWPAASLTIREVEILNHIAAGESTTEIACILWVTPATVSKHLEHIYRKLGVGSRTAALAATGIRTASPGRELV